MAIKKDEFFDLVQRKRFFKDPKTFADAIPRDKYDSILRKYKKAKGSPDFNLYSFLKAHFDLPESSIISLCQLESCSLKSYVDNAWGLLKETFSKEEVKGSLIALPYPHIIPGGRAREAYYWDSYFMAEGLAAKNNYLAIEEMVKNFVYLQDKFGFILNGNRTYYQTHSNPPLLVYMVDLLYQKYGINKIEAYIPALEKEHVYWMKGEKDLRQRMKGLLHVVKMPDGSILNRYCAEAQTPAEGRYIEDMALAEGLSAKEKRRLFQNLRSAAESGWSFSSRWLKDPKDHRTVQTLSIVPIDLNAFLFGLEMHLSQYYGELKNKRKQKEFLEKAQRRKAAIDQYLWDSEKGFYFDFNIEIQSRSPIYSLAGSVPLFVKMADDAQASSVMENIQTKFLKIGGVVTSLTESGLQWDYPNGSAPLQWFTVKGLFNYRFDSLATEIMERWLGALHRHFSKTRTLADKYNVCEIHSQAIADEYPVQEGYGWTNGIVERFLSLLGTSNTLMELLDSPETVMPYEKTDEVNLLLFGDTKKKGKLSKREKECLTYYLQGKTGDQISDLMAITVKAVEFHISNIKRKLDCYNRSQIFDLAIKRGIVKFGWSE